MEGEKAARRIGTILVHFLGAENENIIQTNLCSAESKTLDQERTKATFSVSKLINVLNGGEHITKLKVLSNFNPENEGRSSFND